MVPQSSTGTKRPIGAVMRRLAGSFLAAARFPPGLALASRRRIRTAISPTPAKIQRVSNLKETIDVSCPTFYTMYHAERFFTAHRRDFTPGVLRLRVDLSKLKLPGTGQAVHDVRVQHALIEANDSKRLALSWDPEDQTVPRFSGTLSCAPKDAGVTTLILEGAYLPPLGVAGAAFDLVVGRKIAAATAHGLLEDLKQFIESDFQTARATNLASSPKE
jgi:hypothetical protein